MNWKIDEMLYGERLAQSLRYTEAGKITKSMGLIFEAHLPGAGIGSICRILTSGDSSSGQGVEAEVVGFKEERVLLMPYEEVPGINKDSLVILKRKSAMVGVGTWLLGRVIDARGVPLDGFGFKELDHYNFEERSLYYKPAHPLDRQMIEKPLDLGVRAINGFLTCGKGQRLGILAGSGVGKSVLLGMMAKHTSADINVIALIGERGREVREFIENELGPEGMKKSIVVVSTSDKSPLLRMRGAFLATTIAEYFRDKGKDVLLLMDSVTRFCMAQREIGLSMGEPPASKGYTPSVFSMIPKLLERAGMSPARGSITGLYSVLVEGDDLDDPIADATRSVLDGHIVLSRKIAQKNHFPAIDILQSTSRVMRAVITPEHQAWASQIREWIAIYNQVEDLINIGAYVRGSNPKIDQAVGVNDRITAFLRQGFNEQSNMAVTLEAMHSIVRHGEAILATHPQLSGASINQAQASQKVRF